MCIPGPWYYEWLASRRLLLGSESVVDSYKQLHPESYEKGYIDCLKHQFMIDEKIGHVIRFKSI